MKKVVVSLLLMLAMCLVGCSSDSADSNTGAGNNSGEVGSGNILVLKDFMESITIKGTPWKEYKTESVAADFGIPEGEVKNTEVIFTDKEGKEYQGYSQWEDFADLGGRLLYQYFAPSDEYITTVGFKLDEENQYYADCINVEKNVSLYADYEHLNDDAHAAVVEWQEGTITYLDQNNVSTVKDLLVLWGMDKLDATALEMVTDRTSTEPLQYEFTCTSDCGEATITISNTYSEDKVRIVAVSMSIMDETKLYLIDINESYHGDEEVPYRFYVGLVDTSYR